MIDPSKDKFAYFKDNIQTAEDKVRALAVDGKRVGGGSAARFPLLFERGEEPW
jgi:hypothetical protein